MYFIIVFQNLHVPYQDKKKALITQQNHKTKIP